MKSDSLILWRSLSARIAAFIASGMEIEQAHRTATGDIEALRQREWEEHHERQMQTKVAGVLDAARAIAADAGSDRELRRAAVKFGRAAQKVA